MGGERPERKDCSTEPGGVNYRGTSAGLPRIEVLLFTDFRKQGRLTGERGFSPVRPCGMIHARERPMSAKPGLAGMLIVAVIATLVAFLQNLVMFAFGLKEMAIFSFPLSFIGILLAEVLSIWAGCFCAWRFLPKRRTLALTAWVVLTLGTAEVALPASFFSTWVQHARRESVLNRIEPAGSSIEALASDRGGRRFALTYALKFPRTGHYLTFPAYLGEAGNQVFGDYFTKVHPEYYEESYVFEGGKPYSFTVVFDTGGKPIDFSREKANIDICDGKDYFMACRILPIGVEQVPATLAAHPSPGLTEPAVAEDNVRDIAEKSIRLGELRLASRENRAGSPVGFSFVIGNAGKKDVAIPEGNLASVIAINYGWEPLSESARATKVNPGMVHFGNAVAAGGAQFTGMHASQLSPGEQLPFQDKITPFEPFAPGDYRLHVFLFSCYSTERNRPVQELVQDFTVVP